MHLDLSIGIVIHKPVTSDFCNACCTLIAFHIKVMYYAHLVSGHRKSMAISLCTFTLKISLQYIICVYWVWVQLTRHDTIRYFIAILFCNVAAYTAAAAAVALHGKSRIYIMIIII